MQMLNVNELKVHPDNDYYFDDITGANWDEFKKSITSSGVIEPIVVTQDKMIVSGHQRVRACKELCIGDIGCRIKIYDKGDIEKEVLKDLIETNLRQRGIGNTNPIKFGRCIKALEEFYGIRSGSAGKRSLDPTLSDGKSQSDLADEIGVSQDTLNNHKKLLTLIPELQELVETGQVSASTGSRVWSRMSVGEQEKFFNDIGKDRVVNLTQKETQEEITKLKLEKEALEENNKRLKILYDGEKAKDKKVIEKFTEIDKTDYTEINKLNRQLAEMKTNNDTASERYKRVLDQLKEEKDKVSKFMGENTNFELIGSTSEITLQMMNFVKDMSKYEYLSNVFNEIPDSTRREYVRSIFAVYKWSHGLLSDIRHDDVIEVDGTIIEEIKYQEVQ